MTMKLKKVGVLGAGTTGKGLIRCLAGSGLDVVFCELSKEQVDQAIAQITDDLDVEKAKWGVTESEKRLILSRISGTTDIREMAGSQVIIEAIKGDLECKQEVFQEMDQLFSPDTVLVSSSPTLCVSDIARKTTHPDRVIAMHFPLPVQNRPIVEIVRGSKTSDRTIEVARLLAKLMKKKTFEVFEMPGLITTRIMIPYINEAMHIVMEGLANAEHVDEAVRLGFSLPIGPLAMADKMGLDTLLDDMENLFNALGDLQYRPCPLLRRLVREGHLGVKSGRGFFVYDATGRILGSPTTAY